MAQNLCLIFCCCRLKNINFETQISITLWIGRLHEYNINITQDQLFTVCTQNNVLNISTLGHQVNECHT